METKKVIVLVLVIIFIGGLFVFLWNTRTKTEGDITEQCVKHGPKGIHIHPQLRIVIDGREQTIPADIGISSITCMRPIHTHDASGILHIESPQVKDFTLGQFFRIWDKTFTKECIIDSCADQGTLTMTVNGKEKEEYEKYVLQDKDQITIEYTSNGGT